MTNRNPFVVIALTIITLGLYGIYFFATTTNEMKRNGADIPHWILMFVPFVAIWWLYKYSEGVEKVTSGNVSTAMSFILVWFLPLIGLYFVQNGFNQVSIVGATSPTPSTPEPVAPLPTENSADTAQPLVTPVASPDVTPVASIATDPITAPVEQFTPNETPTPTPVTPPTVEPIEPTVIQPTPTSSEPVVSEPAVAQAPEPVLPTPTPTPQNQVFQPTQPDEQTPPVSQNPIS
jgi:Domain of unknown function (DUF4234)